MILVLGATGTVGSEVVKQLTEAGHRVRALVRDAAKATKLGTKVELALGDLSNPESLPTAFAGVDRVFLCLPVSPELPKLDINAYGAAAKAGVSHIVRTSGGGGGATIDDFMRDTLIAKLHLEGEQRLRALGIPWTFLRPGTFDSNATRNFGITQHGGLLLPAGDGKDAHIDPRDIAAVAVKVLTSKGHEGRIYELTGPELLGYAELVQRINAVTGKSFRYVDQPEEAWREQMLASGAPAFYVDSLQRYFYGVREGRMYATKTVPELLGRPAGTFEQWVRDHAAEFAP